MIEALFNAFDSDKNGLIDYDEFLGVMRGSLTGVRLSVVEQAWRSLDSSHLGQVDLRDLFARYDASGDPSVQDGRHTVEEAFEHFKSTFLAQHSQERREWCTQREFFEYYTDWSALIESD